jgi:hypothetical protein
LVVVGDRADLEGAARKGHALHPIDGLVAVALEHHESADTPALWISPMYSPILRAKSPICSSDIPCLAVPSVISETMNFICVLLFHAARVAPFNLTTNGERPNRLTGL